MSLKVMKVHDIAKLFPMLPPKEMKDLRSDIEANGVVVPILVNKANDTILDGRNRWMIATELKLDNVPLETFKGKDEDIPSEILSRNIFRRHLNDDQRISILAKVLAPKLEAEATARKTKKGSFGDDGKAGTKGTVAAHLAKQGQVSQHKAQQAIKATKAGVVDDVIAGKTSLRKAAGKAPTKKRVKKVATFEDEVWARFDRFMKHWDVTLHRKVKAIVHEFTAPGKPKTPATTAAA